MGRRRGRMTAVRTAAAVRSMSRQLERMRFARSSLPWPRLMPISGEPPRQMREATEPTMVTTGPQTPTPARAMSPISGMLPI